MTRIVEQGGSPHAGPLACFTRDIRRAMGVHLQTQLLYHYLRPFVIITQQQYIGSS